MAISSILKVFALAVLATGVLSISYNQDGKLWDPTAPVTAGGASYAYVQVPNSDAKCLDGSPYGIFICQGPNPGVNGTWTINLQGGGWCYNETDCLGRSKTDLGSSKRWAPQAKNMSCNMPPGNTYVQMWYCDGASFTGSVSHPVQVGNHTLYFRGRQILDSSLNFLMEKYHLDTAKLLVLTGGSAGGLSTFLHLDHVQQLLPKTRVVGQPVCGFFIDHDSDGVMPEWYSYPNFMKYVYHMQNSTGALSDECQSAYGSDAWKCIMAPHAVKFIQTPWFMLQSRFDKWQLGFELFLQCENHQPWSPPYINSTCTPKDDALVRAWGNYTMAQIDYQSQPSRNGGFVDACIIHGSTTSKIDGKTNWQAFNDWLNGGEQKWYIMKCNGSEIAGPCDTAPVCAPYP